MKFQNRYFFSMFLALILTINWFIPAYAAAPTITSISPSLVFNDQDTTITITGTDFL
ncbi:MAG: IPT/TIG domain-containing protein [Anaerolineales bacterium]|nr:IPT/TIG domain-containing protein [Anaerolineales bacterium]